MSNNHFSSFGGGVHHTACIGQNPEDAGWEPGMDVFAPEIAPSARIEAFVTVDGGLEGTTTIGARTWLMKGVHVGHDCTVGDDVQIAPRSVLGGFAEIGDGAKLGIGALILPFRTVGKGATVGAGAVVTRNVEPYSVVAGNPARPIGPKNPIPYSERGMAWEPRILTQQQAAERIRIEG